MKLYSQIEWLEKNFFGNDANILIAKDLRNPKKAISFDYDDTLPPHSYLYRFDQDAENQLFIGGTSD